MLLEKRGRRRLVRWPAAALVLVTLAAACGSPPPPGDTHSPSELKYMLLNQVGPIWFCDPDFYPVGRVITPQILDARLKEIQMDAEVYQVILSHNHLGGTELTPTQKQLVYGDYKQLRALDLEPDGQRYRFKYLVAPKDGKEGTAVEGSIDRHGEIQVNSRKGGAYLNCPICLAEDTLIDTPQGRAPITQLRRGTPVWTLDAAGHRQEAVIAKVGSTTTPAWHEVVHLVLNDGRELWVSPGHPTADGRRVGDLAAGDLLDGSSVAAAYRVPYAGTATFDLLPSGPTGTYWANGILLGSTLR